MSIPVSTQTDEWIAAEVLRDDFMNSQKSIETIEATNEAHLAEVTVQLCARFLTYISQCVYENVESTSACILLLMSIFNHFMSLCLSVKDVHSLAANYDTEVRKVVLISYLQALAEFQDRDVANVSKQPSSVLFAVAAKGNMSIFALSGGREPTRCISTNYNLFMTYTRPSCQFPPRHHGGGSQTSHRIPTVDSLLHFWNGRFLPPYPSLSHS